jgi:hypothetical protein
MRKISLLVALALAVLPLGLGAPAQAVTYGTPDGDDHPYVGLMIAQDGQGNPLWRCTGTLIDAELFLTAGHCTEAPAEHVEIWFAAGPVDTDPRFVESGDCASVPTGGGAAGEGYPCTGDVGGTPYVHPDYDPSAFYLNDLGMVQLDEPLVMDEYGVLPEEGQLSGLKAGKKNGQVFTSVGYGLQRAFPDAASWKDEAEKVRLQANPRLIQIDNGYTGDYSMILTNNANTGGTCFGDSGGPNFIGDSNVIGGVTSYGKNPTCGGQGGVYRVDQPDDLAWIATFPRD